jgi:hypothetical protein
MSSNDDLKQLEAQFPAHYGDNRSLVDRAFSSKSEPGLASKLAKQSPDGYKFVRSLAVEAGLVGQSRRDKVNEMFAKPAAKTYSEDELKARITFSEQEVRRLYVEQSMGSMDNIQKLREKNGESWYQTLVLAARSYGVVVRADEKIVPVSQRTTKAALPATFEPSDELKARFGFPGKIDMVTFERAIKIMADESVRKAEQEGLPKGAE